MRQSWFHGLFSILLTFFLLGCAQQETGTTTSTTTTTTTLAYDSYFPLVAGRIITYEVTEYNFGSSKLESVTIETWEYVGNVPSISSIEVFKINITYKGQTDPYYYREDSSGAYSYGYGSHTTAEPSVELKYPLSVGSTWETGPTGLGWYYEVASEEAVTTSLETFVCKQIVPHVGLIVATRWYAKNVGLIKSSGVSVTKEIKLKNF